MADDPTQQDDESKEEQLFADQSEKKSQAATAPAADAKTAATQTAQAQSAQAQTEIVLSGINREFEEKNTLKKAKELNL